MKKEGIKLNWIIFGVVLIIISAAVVYFAIKSNSSGASNIETSIEQEHVVSAPTSYNIEIKEFAFHPNELTIKVGDTVTWTNRDSVRHTVTSEGTVKELNSGYMGGNAWDNTYSHTFNTSGVYNYYCIVHPSMKGKIIVE